MNGRKFFPLIVVGAGLLAYANSFNGSYFHDDFGSIPENPTIRHLWPIWQTLSPPHRGGLTVESRPLINLSLAFNYALGGYHVWGYHALNVTVHILAGLTLLGIARRTLLQPSLRERFGAAADPLALTIALLWTVHPLQTESVTYIVQRAESVMGMFYLLTLYCFIRGTEARYAGLWYGLSVTACALGMISKEVMITAPVMVLLYDRAFLSESFREAWQRRRPFYIALSATWLLLGCLLVLTIRNALANATRIHLAWWQYLATQPGVILYYLRLSVWPAPLSMEHAWPIARTWTAVLIPGIPVLILLAASVWAWRRKPAPFGAGPAQLGTGHASKDSRQAWGFVGAWFFLILAPSSSFVPALDALYEHRMYLSLAAVVSVVVLAMYSLAGWRSFGLLAAAAIGLGFLTWRRNEVYRRDPDFSLAIALQKEGRTAEAIHHYKRSLRIAPGDATTHYNLGNALKSVGRIDEAIQQWQEAVRINPNFAEPQNNLAVALVAVGKVPDAIEHWEQAVRIRPSYAEGHYNLAIALEKSGRLPEAIAHFEQAARIKPDYAEAHAHLAVALERAGQIQDAVAHYERALRLNPDDATTHYNFGLLLWRAGEVEAAVEHWEKVAQLKPDSADAHNNLGGALLQLGRTQEAIAHLEQALRIKPDLAQAHYNLAFALEQTGRKDEAIKHYQQVLRLKPDSADAQKRLARLQTAPERSGPAAPLPGN
jgi:tetratricopeptide (TPR) repeat protein